MFPSHSRSFLPVLLLALLGIFGLDAPTRAMSWVDALSFDEMASEAELAGRGVVLKIDVGHLWLRGAEEPYLYTQAWVRIDVPYRGLATGDILPVRYFGGYDTASGAWMDIPGLPRLEEGEHVAVFVDQDEHSVFGTVRGEIGLVRFADLGGQMITLNARWLPWVEGLEQGVEDGPPYQCAPLPVDRSQCADWVDPEGAPQGLPLPSGTPGRLIAAEELDALALRSVAPIDSTQPFPRALDEGEFRAELEEFIVRINTIGEGHAEEAPAGTGDPDGETHTDDTTFTIPMDPQEKEVNEDPPTSTTLIL